jgi:hypothetical protein
MLRSAGLTRCGLTGYPSVVMVSMMSYRRKKQASIDKHRYEDFRRDNADLIARIGIPYFIMDDHEHFIYYLEHGVPWPGAPLSFEVRFTDAERYELLKLLVEQYVEAGFALGSFWCLRPVDRDALAERHGH